jgi:hypothetical protein
MSIVDTTVTAPKISQESFPKTPPEHFWTSTPYTDLSGNAWFVCFCDGMQDFEPTASGHYVRCVRSLL